MKRILVVVKFEAYVPEDMTVESLRDNVENVVANTFDGFGVSSKGYHDEDNEWVEFSFDGAEIGTNCMIAIGGD